MIFAILEEMRADKATIKARAATSNGRQLKRVIHWCCQKMSCFSSHNLQTIKLTQLLEREHPRLRCRNIHESVVSACGFFFICLHDFDFYTYMVIYKNV